MATKVFDGFDHYRAAADLLSRSGFLQWQEVFPGGQPSGVAPVMVTGRNGLGQAIQVGGSNFGANRLTAVFATRNAEFFAGHATMLRWPSGGMANGLWVFLYDLTTTTVQLSIHFNEANYSVAAYRGDTLNGSGSTLLGISDNNVWTNNVWQFFEFHPTIANSGGAIEVRVNNNAVLTLSGIDTQNTANAWCDGIAYQVSPYTNISMDGYFIDDFYYNDTTTGPGLVPANSYMGDSSVKTLFAIGNDSVTWTPFANTNWQEVSELAMDSDVSYNFTANVGDEDRFNFQTITSALDTVYAVQVTGAYRKDDGGTRTIEQLVKSGTTEVYSSGHNIPDTSYAYFTDLWVLNPDTSLNWTKTDINSMKAGYKLTA